MESLLQKHLIDLSTYLCVDTDTIEVDIKDDAGDSISFQHGNVVVKLHFRKQRSAYFS